MVVVRKLGLAQMVRFFMVKSIYADSNPRFDVGIVYLQLIIL
jgi:hypothetical protein